MDRVTMLASNHVGNFEQLVVAIAAIPAIVGMLSVVLAIKRCFGACLVPAVIGLLFTALQFRFYGQDLWEWLTPARGVYEPLTWKVLALLSFAAISCGVCMIVAVANLLGGSQRRPGRGSGSTWPSSDPADQET